MRSNSRSIGSLKSYDPRAKLYILLIYLVMCLLSWKIIPVIICALTGAVIVFLSHVKIRTLWDMSKSAVAIELVLSVLLLLYVKPMIVLFLIVKIAMFTFVYNSVLLCMKQVEVLDALMAGFKLGARNSKKVFSVLEYCPEVYKQKRRVREALKARGVEPEKEGIFRGFLLELLLTFPNHRNAVKSLKNKSAAMDMRDFTSQRRRKRIYEIKFEIVDQVVLLAEAVLLLATILF